MINIKILRVLIVVDIVIIAISILFFDIKVLYNTQIGFISSALVMAGSIISYRRMVNQRVEANIITQDDSKDVIDKIEDPHELYDDSKPIENEIKEDEEEPKRTTYQSIKDTSSALSIYRLTAYVVLILGFMYLNRHGLLHIPSYIISLGIAPLVIVVMLLREKS